MLQRSKCCKTGRASHLRSLLVVAVLAATGATPVFAEEGAIPVLTTRWWAAFQHPGLEAAIEQGLSAHPDTATALARIEAAEAGIARARAGRRPQVDVKVGYRWGREQNVETGGVEDDIDPLFGAARLAWELDLFGKASSGIDAASARAGREEARHAGVRLLLSLKIARAYVDVAHLNEQVAWNLDEAEDAQSIYERAKRRAEAGLEEETMRDLALATWKQAEHRLMQTETERDRARSRLTSLVGGTPLDEEPASLSDFTLPPQPDHADEDRLLGRPDVVAAHLAWMESRHGAKASSRERLPSLSLVLSAAADGDHADDPESWSAWAGPVVSLPLWNPGLKATSKQARAREEAAAAELQSVSLRAVEEIDRAWAERSRSESMVGHMQTRREALASVAEVENRKRTAGLIQDDRVRRSQLDAAKAARDELNWRAAALHAHLTLIAAFGG